MDRLNRAREMQLQKKMATERGMPSQLAAGLGKPEPSMAFGRNTDKFKSGFGKDGSQIKKNQGVSEYKVTKDFMSSKVDSTQYNSARTGVKSSAH